MRNSSGQREASRFRILSGITTLLVSGVFLAAGMSFPSSEEAPYDILIRNARIVNGSGGAWYRGDLGIRDGRIARIGRLVDATAGKTIEACERVAAPGFIDVHMHVEGELQRQPDAENLIADGVTSIVTGNCGGSELNIGDAFARLSQLPPAVNAATLIGHNSVRHAVMGNENRPPRPGELAEMERLVRRGMEEGAVGLSTGLIYVPGSYAATSEITALARVVAGFGGLYATHMRNENNKVFESIDEAFAVARDAGLPLQISHFKVTSKRLWGSSRQMLEKVEQARAQGIDVTVDQYPYTASSTRLDVLLPDWALEARREEDSRTALRHRLAKKRLRKKIAAEMYERIHETLGHDHLEYAVVASAPWDPSLAGKSLREINRLWTGKNGRAEDRPDTLASEIETVLNLCELGAAAQTGAGACGAQMVYHAMDEGDIERILAHPLTMVARDGGIMTPGSGRPHPRSYGTAARVLGRYVRERGTVRFEEAIRKMTSLPAQRFGFQDRGLLKEGFWADVVLFDPNEVLDAATYEDPHHESRGIDVVLVNGQLVRENGRPTWLRPGRILYGPGVAPPVTSIADRFPRRVSLAPQASRR